MTKNAEVVFQKMCRYEQHWESGGVYPTTLLAEATGLSRYMVRKAIKELCAEGLAERGSVGRPAVEYGYEYKELVCEAMPPLNGFMLTDKAVDTEIFKEEEQRFIKGLVDCLKE